MEIDKPGAGCEIEDEDQVMIREEQSGGSQAAGRSYECTFCKRGFTNAQALGGHMNIHRKEKAKLKQSISSPNIPKIVSTPARLPWVVPSTLAQGHGHGRGSENTTSTLEETLVGEAPQLPLFVQKPSNMDQKSEVPSDQKTAPSFRHGSAVSELDLELRLGPEPQNSTSSSVPTHSTRHFF